MLSKGWWFDIYRWTHEKRFKIVVQWHHIALESTMSLLSSSSLKTSSEVFGSVVFLDHFLEDVVWIGASGWFLLAYVQLREASHISYWAFTGNANSLSRPVQTWKATRTHWNQCPSPLIEPICRRKDTIILRNDGRSQKMCELCIQMGSLNERIGLERES